MSRPCERTTLLSRDTVAAIRYFCFGNIGEFFERFKIDIGMSRSTFYRVMQGEYATSENVQYIELLATRLKLTDKGGGSSYLVRGRLTVKLVRICKTVIAKCDIKSIDNLRAYIKEYGSILLS